MSGAETGVQARLFLVGQDIELGDAGERVAVHLGPGYDFQVAGFDRMLEGHGRKLAGVGPLYFSGGRGPGVWLGAAIDFTLRAGPGRAAGRGRPD